MIKGEDQIELIKDKFKECEGYFNDLENIFYVKDGENAPEVSIPKIALMVGRLMTNFSDISILLEIFPKE